MKIHSLLCTAGILLGGLTAGHSTIIGFGQLGGSNTDIPANLGSFISDNANGIVISNGATPNIGLTWGADWDIHTSPQFANLENQTVGGGLWDAQTDTPDPRRIGQLDSGNQTIVFSAQPGYALVLNSFDFGHTPETAGTTQWTLSLTDISASVVWTQSFTFTNGQVYTVTPGFTGAAGASYTLTFARTSETYNSNGRHGIDNMSFNQVAVPEPGTIALCLVGAGALVAFRRRK